jgi:hypothetical protein
MEKFKKYTINTVFAIALVFFIITMGITGFQMQKYFLGITELEERVTAIEVEEARKNEVTRKGLEKIRAIDPEWYGGLRND